jgi:hypothetical protein
MPIADTMDVIRTGRQGRHLITLDKYHIYGISRNSSHKNDTHNPIFQTLHELYDRQKHIHPQKKYVSGNHTERLCKRHMPN